MKARPLRLGVLGKTPIFGPLYRKAPKNNAEMDPKWIHGIGAQTTPRPLEEFLKSLKDTSSSSDHGLKIINHLQDQVVDLF